MGEPGKMLVSLVGLRGSVPDPVPVEVVSDKICAAIKIPVPKGADANQKLHSYLQQKRYIIFLDGIWSNDEWNHIQHALPDGRPGSRTIISTRKGDVASYCVKPWNHMYSLEALTRDEGWELSVIRPSEEIIALNAWLAVLCISSHGVNDCH
ncbi:hypothetical protein Pint_03762 [Pistacia integerrima]|uniref:Uncharacterized protein n=1 Tax=Pistacia integerrima TaxID=434235 RepID=A0ACC0Z6D7_9ROSI|nr:hypothetical protein Pint_03762 [Pistacia integerrima]